MPSTYFLNRLVRAIGYAGYSLDAQPSSSNEVAHECEVYRNESESGILVPVVQEELQVGKREVERGGMRIYSRVTERPIEETVRLHEEEVSVARRPVNRPLVLFSFCVRARERVGKRHKRLSRVRCANLPSPSGR